MKRVLPLLLFLFGMCPITEAQQLRFGRAHGYNLIDIKYGNPNGPSMSSLTYVNCCWQDTVGLRHYVKPAPVQFGAWVVNTTSSTKHQVYLKITAQPKALYSDTVSIIPGDSVNLTTKAHRTLHLKGAKFELFEGANLVFQDSLSINQHGTINHSRLSHYFGYPDNFIGTTALGEDGSGFAVLYPLDPNVALTGFSIFTGGANSVTGGDVLVEIYDSSAFTLNGFAGTPLYTDQVSIGNASGWNSQQFSNWVYVSGSKVKYIWVAVRLFSNGGVTPFEVGNSQRVIPSDPSIWYLNTKGNNLWKKASDTTEHIMNPLFHLNTFVSHWDPAPPPVSISEHTAPNRFQLFPNPADDFLQLSLPDDVREAKVHILSMTGQLLLTQLIKREERLDVRQLPPGLYTVRIRSGEHTFSFKQLIE